MNKTESLDLDRLYSTHQQFVRRVCYRVVKDEQIAEDLTQDVFVQVLKNVHRFDGRSHIRTWLYRIAINQSLMWLRSRPKEIVPLFDIPYASDATTPLDAHRLLESVSKESADLLWDRHAEGFSVAEIAKKYGLPISTIKSRLHRAKSEALAAAR